jgi:aminopeptidase N
VVCTTLLLGLPVGLLSPAAQAAPTTPAPSTPGPTTPAPSTPEPSTAKAAPVDTLFPEVGNSGYDALHYDVALRYQPATQAIVATTSLKAKATKRLATFSLDLEGLTVQRVRVNGRPATFTKDATKNKLVIRPAKAIKGTFTTTIDYSGVPVTHLDPDDSSEGWIPTSDGATALNEPVGAMTWFPNNNTPRDKATFTFKITVPSALEVASNGTLSSRKKRGLQTTWTWRQRDPMATYLALLSIGNYDVYHSTMKLRSGRTLPIWSFIDPAIGTLAAERKLIPKIIRFQEQRYGSYPFRSAGIVVKDIGVHYALETQNRPFFDGAPNESTMVHELAHQWFGDSVTPKVWGDIWLNEGFATDAENVWGAAHGGPSTAENFQQVYEANGPTSTLWKPAPAALDTADQLFTEPIYSRGSLVLEALRQKVGSATMDKILQRWARTYRHRTVTTAQFIAVAEQVSGQNLDAFFDSWLYAAEKPAGY